MSIRESGKADSIPLPFAKRNAGKNIVNMLAKQ